MVTNLSQKVASSLYPLGITWKFRGKWRPAPDAKETFL